LKILIDITLQLKDMLPLATDDITVEAPTNLESSHFSEILPSLALDIFLAGFGESLCSCSKPLFSVNYE